MSLELMVTTKLLLCDLDGTIRKPKSGNEFSLHFRDQIVIPEVSRRLKQYKKKGWKILGISHQGGCEAINPDTGIPYKTRNQAIQEMRYLLKICPELDKIYFCPNSKDQGSGKEIIIIRRPWWVPFWINGTHETNDDHPYYFGFSFRKPQPGMIELAIQNARQVFVSEEIKAFGESVREESIAFFQEKYQVLMIGNSNTDFQTAVNAEIPFQFVERWVEKPLINP